MKVAGEGGIWAFPRQQEMLERAHTRTHTPAHSHAHKHTQAHRDALPGRSHKPPRPGKAGLCLQPRLLDPTSIFSIF